jgi:hypothetical protein
MSETSERIFRRAQISKLALAGTSLKEADLTGKKMKVTNLRKVGINLSERIKASGSLVIETERTEKVGIKRVTKTERISSSRLTENEKIREIVGITKSTLMAQNSLNDPNTNIADLTIRKKAMGTMEITRGRLTSRRKAMAGTAIAMGKRRSRERLKAGMIDWRR